VGRNHSRYRLFSRCDAKKLGLAEHQLPCMRLICFPRVGKANPRRDEIQKIRPGPFIRGNVGCDSAPERRQVFNPPFPGE